MNTKKRYIYIYLNYIYNYIYNYILYIYSEPSSGSKVLDFWMTRIIAISPETKPIEQIVTKSAILMKRQNRESDSIEYLTFMSNRYISRRHKLNISDTILEMKPYYGLRPN